MPLEWLLVVAISANLTVSLGYVALGILFATKFDAAAPTWALTGFKVAGFLFFTMCAITHIHEAFHIWDGLLPTDYWLTWHYFGHMLVQAAASAAASTLGFGFVSLRIFDRVFYAGLLDRAIDEQAAHLAAMVRTQDVKAVAHEARIVADAAELIHRAMRGGE